MRQLINPRGKGDEPEHGGHGGGKSRAVPQTERPLRYLLPLSLSDWARTESDISLANTRPFENPWGPTPIKLGNARRNKRRKKTLLSFRHNEAIL